MENKRVGKEPLISVIIPIYNVEKYLRQCIESVMNQTYKNLEIILVDDGSTDQCSIICDEFASLDERIKVIHKVNGGLVSARKEGLSTAAGEYVTYVDGDDWIEDNMYESMIEILGKFDVDIIISGFIAEYANKSEYIDNNIESGLYNNTESLRSLKDRMLYDGHFFEFGLYPVVWNKLFKRELLTKNQNNVSNYITMGEDVACSFPAILDAQSVYILEKKYLYHYRRVAGTITSSYDSKYFEKILELYKYLQQIFLDRKEALILKQLNYYFLFLIKIGLNMEFSRVNKSSYSEKLTKVKKFIDCIEVSNMTTSLDIKNVDNTTKKIIKTLNSKNVIFLSWIIYRQKFINKFNNLINNKFI